MARRPQPMEGHGQPCYYCNEPCDGLAGNPNKWPIPLSHRDAPGYVKWHHVDCVTRRLIENCDAAAVCARLAELIADQKDN